MPQPDYSFPSYLAPPTEAQRDQIGLARARQANDNAQTEIAVREAQRKAGVMMRRQIGLSKMKEDVASAVSKGVDPLTARQNALVDNAEWLFSDNPEAVARITESQLANQVKEKKALQEAQQKEIKNAFDSIKLDHAQQLIELKAKQLDDLNTSRSENLDLKQKLAEEKRNQLSPQEREREDLVNLRSQARSLKQQLAKPEDEYPGQAKELSQKLEDVDTKLQAWEVQHNAREETIETTPQGGVKIVRGGTAAKAPGALTTAEQTNYGEDLQAASNALRSLGQLKAGITSAVVGPGAAMKSVIFDKFMAALDPAFENPERVKGRARIGATAQVIAGELGRKFRLSEAEMRRVEASLPSTGFFESPARAKDAVSILQQTLGEKGANAATRLGRPVPPEILRNLAEIDDEALTQDAEQGYLDPKVYWQVRRLKYPKPAAQPAP